MPALDAQGVVWWQAGSVPRGRSWRIYTKLTAAQAASEASARPLILATRSDAGGPHPQGCDGAERR